MKFDHDLICIGLGPAGMAVSVMGSSMGLDVCSIERNKLGGECMNVGCIPSKSLLSMAKARHTVSRFGEMELEEMPAPRVKEPFKRIAQHIKYINDRKTMAMFDKVELHLREGDATFVDPHTVEVGGKRHTARRIFIAVGTHPALPPIPGLDEVECLTNETLFSLEEIPESMVVLGGGAIGCEMAQAFSRLGCKTSVVHMDAHLLPSGNHKAGDLLQAVFEKEGIEVFNRRRIAKVEPAGDGAGSGVKLHTDRGEVLEGEKLLVAAGRRYDFSSLNLGNAGVKLGPSGAIQVDDYLRTTQKHIYAVGDCNGHYLLSHAAMHQGMIALMNSMTPYKQRFEKYVVPWTVFTEPEVSRVGTFSAELKRRDVRFRTIELPYEDFGAAVAENVSTGFVRVYCSAAGKIYGVTIVGEGSGNLINEWALAIQKGVRMHEMMMLQHSFPTMGFMNKMVAERWMMGHMKSGWLQKLSSLVYRT